MDSGRSGPATLILLSLVAGWSQGLEILSAPENVQAGDGDSVMLPCQFRVTNADIGPLDIEWSRTPTNLVDSPLIIIDYSGDRVYETQLEDMKGRVHFSSSDPKTGDASLNITRLKSTDSGRYHCKVKKSPGSKTISIKLSVLVRPSKPMCSVEGSQEIGKDVILKCSSEGTPPITYFWTREGSSMPSTAVADITQGTLKVKNATEAYSGNYKCVARNQIDSSQCFAKLAITSSSNNAGRTAGIVIAVLLFLLILAIIIWCLFWRKKKKTYEKEQSYEIREDVPAPKSRVSTARSYTVDSQRSSLGSMSPSNIEPYKTHYDRLATDDLERLPNHSPNINPSFKVAAPSLNRMGAVPVMIPAQHRDGSIV
ncbi:hypothetical protein scyTo_0011327 [Scyliorhinus torazame]|uniref:Ig-like domain-containing protein n=1 Tax=Scyliorhinus torazame TaxID=75743 RepID=A0A401NKV6_SCYTO|nr:hypothetical protein [Scyliorhinus torazame]